MTQEAVPVLAAAIALVATSRRVVGATADFTPIRACTKAAATYQEVRSRVLDGTIAPGAAINQRQLAKALGISIIPLREALARLESEGLVQRTSCGSLRVTPLSHPERADLVAVQLLLEPFAAGLAASNGTAPERDALTALTVRMEGATPDDWGGWHRDFHELVYTMTRNQVLLTSLQQVWTRLDRYRHPDHPTAAATSGAVLGHRAIALGIGAGDGATAAAAMMSHLEYDDAIFTPVGA
ncbi:MAG: GntR family transcriptional regulator [Candidatus Dormiibacterota bacterium]